MAEMSEKAKAMRRAYIKAWKKNHPDRVKEHTRKYWEKKAAEAERLAQAAGEVDTNETEQQEDEK